MVTIMTTFWSIIYAVADSVGWICDRVSIYADRKRRKLKVNPAWVTADINEELYFDPRAPRWEVKNGQWVRVK